MDGPRHAPFPAHLDVDPGDAVLVDLLVDVGRERNGRHDAVAELLVEHGLVRVPVVLDDLVQAVDQGLFGRHLDALAAVGKAGELGRERAVVDAEVVGQFLDVFL